VPTVYEDVWHLENELARKLRSPLMQRVYMEHWKAPEVCKVVGLDKRVEKSRKRQCSQVDKAIN